MSERQASVKGAVNNKQLKSITYPTSTWEMNLYLNLSQYVTTAIKNYTSKNSSNNGLYAARESGSAAFAGT